jgi:antitoxin (DNA-binding transcriptional repressor) of toxin-antitoxin stability system
MKVIDLKEAKANLELYAQECQSTPVIVAVHGEPVFEMLPLRSDDPDFVDRLLETNADFRALMEERRRESDRGRVSSLEEVRQRLAIGANEQT